MVTALVQIISTIMVILQPLLSFNKIFHLHLTYIKKWQLFFYYPKTSLLFTCFCHWYHTTRNNTGMLDETFVTKKKKKRKSCSSNFYKGDGLTFLTQGFISRERPKKNRRAFDENEVTPHLAPDKSVVTMY